MGRDQDRRNADRDGECESFERPAYEGLSHRSRGRGDKPSAVTTGSEESCSEDGFGGSDYRSFEFEEKVGHPSQNAELTVFKRVHALVHAALDNTVPVSCWY